MNVGDIVYTVWNFGSKADLRCLEILHPPNPGLTMYICKDKTSGLSREYDRSVLHPEWESAHEVLMSRVTLGLKEAQDAAAAAKRAFEAAESLRPPRTDGLEWEGNTIKYRGCTATHRTAGVPSLALGKGVLVRLASKDPREAENFFKRFVDSFVGGAE